MFCFLGPVAFAGPVFEHLVPDGVIRGDRVRIEVVAMDAGPAPMAMWVYYRELGSGSYDRVKMQREGMIYGAEVSTAEITAGSMEYFIAYEGYGGMVGTLPEDDPQMRPYRIEVAPARTGQETAEVELVIISPLPEDVIASDEVLVAASVMAGESRVDHALSRLTLDEVDVTARTDFGDGLITHVPRRLSAGRHIVVLTLYDTEGELLLTREWAFRVIEREPVLPGLRINGTAFLDGRHQNLSGSKDDFFRGGISLNGDVGRFDFLTHLFLSSEETKEAQPVHRFRGELRYNFTRRSRLYLSGGDLFPFYNPLTFQDKRVRGIQAGWAVGFLTFDFIRGQTLRSVEGSEAISSTGDTTTTYGTYAERITAFRPGFRVADAFHWNLNLINARQDPRSILIGQNARESLIVGSDLSVFLDRRRILFEATVQASLKNTDAGAPELEFSEFVELDSSFADNALAEKAFNFLTKSGWLSPTIGLDPLPSLAMEFDLRLKYLNQNLVLTYKSINSEFESPGNPYLLKDIKGFYLSDNIRFLKNRLILNLYYKGYRNNLVEDAYSTLNREFGTTVSYFPFRRLPSLTLGYESVQRSNGVTEADTVSNSTLYIEDNRYSRFSAATSHNFQTGKIRNTLSFHISSYRRMDEVSAESESDFFTLTAGLRTRFSFPLTSRLSYSRSTSSYGDTSAVETSFDRFNIRLDYTFRSLFGGDQFRPFVNLSLQTIDTQTSEPDMERTRRNHISFGLMYRSVSYGIFTLRFDHIDYTMSDEDRSDRIINARYEIAL